jgi:hypothetical protein
VSKTKLAAKLFSQEWKAILAELKLMERAIAAQSLILFESIRLSDGANCRRLGRTIH